ncbi:MAG: CoA-binding protein [Thermoplasmata archaeon]|nr:CoA-binding protein [Thermoplasmata archaeon]MCJ7561869.1 CoA-binding protein [Thermoplasmata archaeon]
MKGPLSPLFSPRSIALIGASASAGKISNVVLKNLLDSPFKVYPVNPREDEILGAHCYPSVSSIPDEIDLALIALPAMLSIRAVEDCIRKGVRIVIVTSSGFAESGQDGKILQDGLRDLIGVSGTRLLGPNTMGLMVPFHGLDTLFIPVEKSRRPPAGSIAIISQSGAVAVSFLEKAESFGMGISACIGLGNRVDINENELLEFFADDPNTDCVALYLESFADGRSFVDIARRISKIKPIVVLKAGRTSSGSRAASSHTGALASDSDELVAGALRQAGVIRVYDDEELVDVARVLAYKGKIDGDRVCVVASAGGFGVIASDFVESKEHGVGMTMAGLSEETRARLSKTMPTFSSVNNPVDLTAEVTDLMYEQVLEALQEDPGIDVIMMSLELQPPHVTQGLVDVAARRSSQGRIPIIISAFGGSRTQETLRALESRKIPSYPTIWRAIRAIAALHQRGSYLMKQK